MKCFIGLAVLFAVAGIALASDFRIIHPKPAPLTPYQIALFQDNFFQCGGALIGPRTVLTAGHCVFFHWREPRRYKIHYGSQFYENGTTLNIEKIIPHPLFKYYKEPEYDVSILHLTEPFHPGPHASTIKLADRSPDVGAHVSVTGWGRLSEATYFQERLQIADTLVVVNQTDCQHAWNNIHITKHILCAHDPAVQQGICGGDSGGPLIHNGTLVGVASFALAPDCTKLTRPNGFADVANLRDFIDKHII